MSPDPRIDSQASTLPPPPSSGQRDRSSEVLAGSNLACMPTAATRATPYLPSATSEVGSSALSPALGHRVLHPISSPTNDSPPCRSGFACAARSQQLSSPGCLSPYVDAPPSRARSPQVWRPAVGSVGLTPQRQPAPLARHSSAPLRGSLALSAIPGPGAQHPRGTSPTRAAQVPADGQRSGDPLSGIRSDRRADTQAQLQRC